MNKARHIIVFSVSLALAGLLLGFALDKSADAFCMGLDIDVQGGDDLRFVTVESLQGYLAEHGHSFEGRPMQDIDTYGIEEDLKAIPFVESATVYKTIDKQVHVQVNQRRPVMRVIDSEGKSCYLDDEGKYLQTAKRFSYKCIPVTGMESIAGLRTMEGAITPESPAYAVWAMSRYIMQDEFWRAQVEQIDLDPKLGITLIPRVGNHEIILGDGEDYISKFDKLSQFYAQGIQQTNWNKYQRLDLRYKDQVVAVKR